MEKDLARHLSEGMLFGRVKPDDVRTANDERKLKEKKIKEEQEKNKEQLRLYAKQEEEQKRIDELIAYQEQFGISDEDLYKQISEGFGRNTPPAHPRMHRDRGCNSGRRGEDPSCRRERVNKISQNQTSKGRGRIWEEMRNSPQTPFVNSNRVCNPELQVEDRHFQREKNVKNHISQLTDGIPLHSNKVQLAVWCGEDANTPPAMISREQNIKYSSPGTDSPNSVDQYEDAVSSPFETSSVISSYNSASSSPSNFEMAMATHTLPDVTEQDLKDQGAFPDLKNNNKPVAKIRNRIAAKFPTAISEDETVAKPQDTNAIYTSQPRRPLAFSCPRAVQSGSLSINSLNASLRVKDPFLLDMQKPKQNGFTLKEDDFPAL